MMAESGLGYAWEHYRSRQSVSRKVHHCEILSAGVTRNACGYEAINGTIYLTHRGHKAHLGILIGRVGLAIG
jgi:hypothetical protein